MDWSIADFVIMGALVTGAALALYMAFRRSGSLAYRGASAIAAMGAFLLIWVNGAVGIIGSENHDANMLFLGVLAVGFIGALIARFRPRGMAAAQGATALAQALVALAALAAGWGQATDIVFATAFFTALWVLSAWLFRRAAQGKAPAPAA